MNKYSKKLKITFLKKHIIIRIIDDIDHIINKSDKIEELKLDISLLDEFNINKLLKYNLKNNMIFSIIVYYNLI